MIRAALRAHIPSPTRGRSPHAPSSINSHTEPSTINGSPSDPRRRSTGGPSSSRYINTQSSANVSSATENSNDPSISPNDSSRASLYITSFNQVLSGGNAVAGPSSAQSFSPSPRSLIHKRSYEPIVESMAIGTDSDSDSELDPESDSELHNNDGSDHGPPSLYGSFHNETNLLNSVNGMHRSSLGSKPTPEAHRHNHQRRHGRANDENSRCPVCNRRFDPVMTEPDRENHITECLKAAEFSGSPEQTHRANRMILYKLPEREAKSLGECVICLDDFHSGDSVGRLECLCVYHEKCILDWFSRKGAGECPVHAVNS